MNMHYYALHYDADDGFKSNEGTSHPTVDIIYEWVRYDTLPVPGLWETWAFDVAQAASGDAWELLFGIDLNHDPCRHEFWTKVEFWSHILDGAPTISTWDGLNRLIQGWIF